MLPVFTAEAMRALDRRAIDELGIPGATLMENAGAGATAALVARFPSVLGSKRPVVIVCGKGGNAGDGFVVGRHLRRRGVAVDVLMTTPPEQITGDAAGKLAAMQRARIHPLPVGHAGDLAQLLGGAEVVVDALLGTGTRGAPDDVVARAIAAINECGRPVVALDIPSGLPADGGAPGGAVVRADLTTTFAGLKRGLVMGPGVALAGDVVVVPIGVPADEITRGVTTFLVEREDVARHFPPRPRESHKGEWGRLLVIAGSVGKTGAAALAARAAMRSGGGLVTVATAASQQPIVASLVTEPMTEPVEETSARTIGLKALDRLAALAEERDAVALGPGLGLDAETAEVVVQLVRKVRKPMVVDADALTALVGRFDALDQAAGPRCLTPHPGEMARLIGASNADVQRDRITIAHYFATTRRVHLVLKGATTVIATPEGQVFLNPTGNPGMASGGTGDVLTGIAGAFLARGLDPVDALISAVWLHGYAGDVAVRRTGEESLIASDLIAALPVAFRSLRSVRRIGRITMLR